MSINSEMKIKFYYLILFLVSSYLCRAQENRLEESIMKCHYDAYEDEGKALKFFIEEQEDFLVGTNIFPDRSGNSYFQMLKAITSGAKPYRNLANSIQNELAEINNPPTEKLRTCIPNPSKNNTNASALKVIEVERLFSKLSYNQYVNPLQISKELEELLEPEDFELDYYKYKFFLLLHHFVVQNEPGYLTKDGAWCWFSDPRAIIANNTVITGWVKSTGTIEAVSFDLISKKITTHNLFAGLDVDDHANPAFTITQSNEILALYAKHGRKSMYSNRLTNYEVGNTFGNAKRINPLNTDELKKFPVDQLTYANPYYLSEENKLYCFGRWTGYKPNIMWSEDDGHSWSKSNVFISKLPFDEKNRPYVKYHSDGKSKVHIVFTDGHPRDEEFNAVYYAYYENGAFFNASGTQICTLNDAPFEPKEASIIYKPRAEDGRAWIADIGQDNRGKPVVLFTKSPTEENHEYWYSYLNNNKWVSRKICDSGKWFPKTDDGKVETEPHYFGGMTLHPNKSNVVYLSRQVNNVFEIERWETSDKGTTWKFKSITTDSTYDNVRPYVPRGLGEDKKEIVLWMENYSYRNYRHFDTSIKYEVLESTGIN